VELSLGTSYTDRTTRCLRSQPDMPDVLSCQNAGKLNILMLLSPNLTVLLLTLLGIVLYVPAKK